jgi:hypothetical protein
MDPQYLGPPIRWNPTGNCPPGYMQTVVGPPAGGGRFQMGMPSVIQCIPVSQGSGGGGTQPSQTTQAPPCSSCSGTPSLTTILLVGAAIIGAIYVLSR